MKKAFLTIVMLVAFTSLFFVPTDDHISWKFILDESIRLIIFVVAGLLYSKAEAKAE